MDRRSNSIVRATAAVVARHSGVDLVIGRMRRAFQERGRRHDLPRLAIAALGYVEVDPRPLKGMECGPFGEALDGAHRLARDTRHRRQACSRRLAVDVHRAGAALPDATPELGTD